MTIRTRATIEDLYNVPDGAKAELVDGKLVTLKPTGGDPGYAGDEIFVALREYARRTGYGRAVSDNKGFRVSLPHRESFSSDAALYVGPNPGMKFYDGAPIFAAEVRSESDYGPDAEAAMARKRADYFAAGTLVVWDVDLLGDIVVRAYRAGDPERPLTFRRGDAAHAEPAVPGWTLPVIELFPAEDVRG
jgi:Uma2 family endonuclease